MGGIEELKELIRDTTELSRLGEYTRALKLLDDALTKAITEHRHLWVRIVSHHAAVMCESQGDLRRATRYYEQSLANVSDDSAAMYGLAELLLRQGKPQEAKQYALRCYELCVQRDGEHDRALVETIVKRWPDISK